MQTFQRVRWEASPPPGPARPARPNRPPYLGPPSYPSPPRWGFPPLAWRWQTSVPGTRTRPPASVDRVRVLARQAALALWVLAAFTLLAAGAETWRYVLLIRSRTGALPRNTVDASDALVVSAAVLSIALAVVALGLAVWWLFEARDVAGELGGQEPARPSWQLLVYLAVPGLNLIVPGAVLAELEHAVLRRPLGDRPRPSRLLLWWWGAWMVSGLLFALTVAWRFRTSVQAQADGVVLNALTYLAAFAVAVLTIRVIRSLTTLLAPIDPARARLMRVIKVDGAPAPPLRPARPAGSPR